MSKISISVVMITYNHECFIEQAINGVLMQQGDFDIELIIADDCSLDNTKKIVSECIKTQPNGHWIKYTRHQSNIGMMPNFIWALEQAKGKYIALCEGDDYWTDPFKLQKQIAILEGNKEFVLCFHKVKIYTNNDNEFLDDHLNEDTDSVICCDDILKKNKIRTLSVVFRNNIINIREKKYALFPKSTPGDWLLFIMLLLKGKAKFINETLGIYRVSDIGVWSLRPDAETKYSVQIANGFNLLYKILPFDKYQSVHSKYLYYIGFSAIKSLENKQFFSFLVFKLKLYYLICRNNFLTKINQCDVK